jgi:penicillin-binding protein 1A
MVAGLLVAPTRYSPYINPEYARNRQGYVLHRLYLDKKITKEQYEVAKKEKTVFRLKRKNEFKAGYFTEWVRQRVIAKVGEENFLKDGYKVVTTLDWELQKVAEKHVLNGVREVDKRQGFRGPIRHDDLSVLAKSEENFRKKLATEKSTYFTIDEKNQKVFEFPYSAEEFVKVKAKSIIDEKLMLIKNVKPGFDNTDSFLKFMEPGERFEATVTRVNDELRVVFVSIAGVSAIIPQDYFKWAHERYTSDVIRYFTPVVRPSTILAAGDIILVQVEKASVILNSYFPKEINSLIPLAEQNKLKKEKYVLCSLDQYPEVQGSLVSMTPTSGEIISFVGGNDFLISKFNRVIQSKRQPGSSFKPFIFAAAIENGFTPNSIILDTPEALSGLDDTLAWKPKNYDNEFKGPVTFRTSLEQSRNIPTIKIAHKVGINKLTNFLDRITFEAKFDHDLSISLGSFGVSILELVNMYILFPNHGKIVDFKSITSITDRDGNITNIEEGIKVKTALERSKIQSEVVAEGENKIKFAPYMTNLKENVVYDPRLAYVMTNLLKGVVHHGTAREARELSSSLAGKTGTTSNYVDAWFIGFNPFLVTGVWIGFDDNKSMGYGETGGRAALPIWKEYMRAGIRKYGDEDFQVPDGIVNVPIDKETGEAFKKGVRGEFIEAFVEGTEPGTSNSRQKTEGSETIVPEKSGGLVEEEGYLESQ